MYPLLFEDYLSHFLPIGGAMFKFGSAITPNLHGSGGSSRSQQHHYQSPSSGSNHPSQWQSNKHSLLRQDFTAFSSPTTPNKSEGFHGSHQVLGDGDMSVEARRSHIFVEIVTTFWLLGSMESLSLIHI